MRGSKSYLRAAVLVFFASMVTANSAEETQQEFSSLQAKAAKRAYDSTVQTAQKKYLQDLAIALNNETRSGNLNEAVLIRKEIEQITESLERPNAAKPHAIVGTWEYLADGRTLQREFTRSGRYILTSGNRVFDEQKYKIVSPTMVEVDVADGRILKHTIREDGTLDIEGRYIGRKTK